ncbi:MAG: hypothetical protein LLG04_04925 [Parachlamydia sp.]|nr:hypothetical protein [Parachlamydia sp.]
MNILKLISPVNNNFPSIENFDSKTEFSRMTKIHKVITVVATGAITLATLGLATTSYFHKLVGRFRKLELAQQNTTHSATKINALADFTSVTTPAIDTKPSSAHLPPNKPLPPPPVPVVKQQTPVPAPQSPPAPVIKQQTPALKPPAVSEPKQAPKPVRKPASDYNKVESDFWEDQFRNEKLHRFLEMAAINGGDDHQAVAARVIDHYIKFKEEQNPTFAITASHRSSLIQSVRAQLLSNEHPKHEPVQKPSQNGQFEADVSNFLGLPDGRQLIVYSTVGDGSCAIHALLGRPDDHGQYRTDAAKQRNDLSDWLEQKQREKQLPESVRGILEDYFINFDLSTTATFRNTAQSQYDRYRAEFDKVSPKQEKGKAGPPMSPKQLQEREAIVNAFINDPVVFKAYLTDLRNTNRYMLQEEVQLAAEYFKKHVILYQPYPNGGEVGILDLNASAPGEPVHVWYNGGNHYEHATVV